MDHVDNLPSLFQPPTAAIAIEKDVLMYRSYIAQKKYTVVLDEVLSSSPAEVQAIRMLADYLHSPAKRYVNY